MKNLVSLFSSLKPNRGQYRSRNEIRKTYNIIVLLLLIIMFIVCSSFAIYSLKRVEAIYVQQMEKSVTAAKSTFLKDTVNNIMGQIELEKMQLTNEYQQQVAAADELLDEYYHSDPQHFLPLSIKYFNLHPYHDALAVIIIDTSSDKILYNTMTVADALIYSPEAYIDLIKEEIECQDEQYGSYRVLYALKRDFINTHTKKHMADIIHNSQFENGVYIWVNEILDYNGGDNYAIRRIHPNLTATEGMYLSTNMKDVKGNQPYLIELEGIKKDGELFFTYYFKKLESDIIAEKLTYAKLYKDYNWIIAIGIHLDDIQEYVDASNINTKHIIFELVRNLLSVILIVLVLGVMMINWLEKWYFHNANRKLKEEVYIDTLTQAFNRRAAIYELNSLLEKYNEDKLNPALLLFDIDDFKLVNDNYGHDVGDYVLVAITKTIKENVRNTDKLYRWGGEEFLLVCNGLIENKVLDFSNHLRETIGNIKFKAGETEFQVTISIGVTYFYAEDPDIDAAIKRADIAMYKAKTQGKNQVCLYQK